MSDSNCKLYSTLRIQQIIGQTKSLQFNTGYLEQQYTKQGQSSRKFQLKQQMNKLQKSFSYSISYLINFLYNPKNVNLFTQTYNYPLTCFSSISYQSHFISSQMQAKSLTPKHIFRTIVFQYHLPQTIPLELLAQAVSNLYYPNDLTGQIRKRYKLILVSYMKQFSNNEKSIDQEQFCLFFDQMQKHSNKEYTKIICERIFNRYKNNQIKEENVIDLEGFKKLSKAFGLPQEEISKCYYSIANRKNLVAFEKFFELVEGERK